jgi:1-acyl-sn-glycerol-3-phosphate acyltransferase
MSSSCLVFVVVVVAVAVAVPVAVAVAAAAAVVVVVQQHQRRACGFNISVHKSVQASESSKQVVLIINHSNNLDVVLTIRSKWVAAIPHSTTIQS